MKIAYKKSRVYFPLVFGLLWLGVAVWSFYAKQMQILNNISSLCIALVEFILFFMRYQHNYVEITGDKMIYYTPFKNTLFLDELTTVEFMMGDYVFKTPGKKVRIVKARLSSPEVAKMEKCFNRIRSGMEVG